MYKYYWESVGECVSQVYEIGGATDFQDAKRLAFKDIATGDHIAECLETAIAYAGEFAALIKTSVKVMPPCKKGRGKQSQKILKRIWKKTRENITILSRKEDRYGH